MDMKSAKSDVNGWKEKVWFWHFEIKIGKQKTPKMEDASLVTTCNENTRSRKGRFVIRGCIIEYHMYSIYKFQKMPLFDWRTYQYMYALCIKILKQP